MPAMAWAVGALFVSGAMFPFLMVAFITLLQRATDNAYMGRVMSLATMSMSVASILSLTASGALTDAFGVRHVIAAGGAVLVTAGAVGLAIIRAPKTAQPADEPPPDEHPRNVAATEERLPAAPGVRYD